MRRLLALAAVAAAGLSVAVPSAPASAASEPPCYGAYAGGYDLGYCAGIVCTDLCYWMSYPRCAQPESSPADICATWTTVLPGIR